MSQALNIFNEILDNLKKLNNNYSYTINEVKAVYFNYSIIIKSKLYFDTKLDKQITSEQLVQEQLQNINQFENEDQFLDNLNQYKTQYKNNLYKAQIHEIILDSLSEIIKESQLHYDLDVTLNTIKSVFASPCDTCLGTGFEVCPICNGSGFNKDNSPCLKCNTQGQIICHKCNGAKYLANFSTLLVNSTLKPRLYVKDNQACYYDPKLLSFDLLASNPLSEDINCKNDFKFDGSIDLTEYRIDCEDFSDVFYIGHLADVDFLIKGPQKLYAYLFSLQKDLLEQKLQDYKQELLKIDFAKIAYAQDKSKIKSLITKHAYLIEQFNQEYKQLCTTYSSFLADDFDFTYPITLHELNKLIVELKDTYAYILKNVELDQKLLQKALEANEIDSFIAMYNYLNLSTNNISNLLKKATIDTRFIIAAQICFALAVLTALMLFNKFNDNDNPFVAMLIAVIIIVILLIFNLMHKNNLRHKITTLDKSLKYKILKKFNKINYISYTIIAVLFFIYSLFLH